MSEAGESATALDFEAKLDGPWLSFEESDEDTFEIGKSEPKPKYLERLVDYLTESWRRLYSPAWLDGLPRAYVEGRLVAATTGECDQKTEDEDECKQRWYVTLHLCAALLTSTQRMAPNSRRAARSVRACRALYFAVVSAPARTGLSDKLDTRERSLWLDRVERARADWLDDLLGYERTPELRGLRPEILEALAHGIVWQDRPGGKPLAFESKGVEAAGGNTAGETRDEGNTPAARSGDSDSAAQRALLRMTREFYLRRFMVGDAWRAVSAANSSAKTTLGVVAALGALAVGAFSLHLLTAWWWPTIVAGWLSVAGFAAVAGFVAARGSEVAYPLLLRLPAGAALGVFAVVTQRTDWIVAEVSGATVQAILVLVGATLGYLLIEVRAHGARGHVVGLRALGVLGIGALGALLVATVAVYLLGPATDLGLREGRAVAPGVLLTAAIGLAVGVFLQLLWEERPVTDPLEHLAVPK